MNNSYKTYTQRQFTTGRHLFVFFLLAFIFAIPFWVIGEATGFLLLPGLPVSALSVVSPAMAAIVLAYRENKLLGVTVLLKRSFDFKRISPKVWYAPILLLMPVVMLLSFWVLRLAGTQVPAPQITVFQVLALSAVFFIAAVCEELGWSGYATDTMQDNMGALQAGITIGLVWAVYHYVALSQVHRSLAWIVWWSLYTVAMRVIIVWLYNNTGKSVFAAALFHMSSNVAWQLFPINGSYYDPAVSGSTLVLMAAAIVALYGPRTLVRKRM